MDILKKRATKTAPQIRVCVSVCASARSEIVLHYSGIESQRAPFLYRFVSAHDCEVICSWRARVSITAPMYYVTLETYWLN